MVYRYPIICRYAGQTAKDYAIANNEDKRFWRSENGSVSSIAKAIRMIRGRTSKAVCVLVGHQIFMKTYGHAQALVIRTEADGVRAYVKDCLPIGEANVKMHVYDLLKELKIREVTLVGSLDTEEYVFYTECLREGYKVIGDILDGRFFWNIKIDAFKKTYDAVAKIEIARYALVRKASEKEMEKNGVEVVKSEYGLRNN